MARHVGIWQVAKVAGLLSQGRRTLLGLVWGLAHGRPAAKGFTYATTCNPKRDPISVSVTIPSLQMDKLRLQEIH